MNATVKTSSDVFRNGNSEIPDRHCDTYTLKGNAISNHKYLNETNKTSSDVTDKFGTYQEPEEDSGITNYTFKVMLVAVYAQVGLLQVITESITIKNLFVTYRIREIDKIMKELVIK